MPRVTENEVALAVLKIAVTKPNDICTFDDARAEVPDHIALSADDMQESDTRPGEQMWHQQIRNIQSHHDADGNFIREGMLEHVPGEGYRATVTGKAYLNYPVLLC